MIIEKVVCDACEKEFTGDVLALQEFMHWKMNCGYGSAWGDLNNISIDLCTHCQVKILGDYMTVNGEKDENK